MIGTIFAKFNRYVFSSIIYLQTFQLVSYDGLYYSLEYFKLLKYLILGFHESYQDSSIVILNKGDEIERTILSHYFEWSTYVTMKQLKQLCCGCCAFQKLHPCLLPNLADVTCMVKLHQLW
jgi:hypothetical protein